MKNYRNQIYFCDFSEIIIITMKSVIFLGSLISGLIILLPSCKKQVVKIEGGIQVSINTDKIDTFYKASDIFESVRIVPLETIDESLLGNISKVVIANNIIYVLDNHIKTIVLFDLDGKFIKKINRRGRGSKEYIDLEDFVVLPNRNMVLLDGESQKLIFLDESGEPFDEQKLPFFCDAFEQLTESVLVFNGAGYNDRIIVWDVSEKKIITSFLKYDVKYSTKPLKPLIKYDNMVYYFHDYLSHLYDVTPESISVCWSFDFGSRTIKESDLQMGMFGAYFKF